MKKEEKTTLVSLEDFKMAMKNHPAKELEGWFDELANCLMNYLVLQIGESKYRTVECEIYYNNGEENDHYDPYVHADDQQKTCGNLFANYAGGIDITFGNETVFAGILIRSMRNLTSRKDDYVNGVWKVAEQLINNMGSPINHTIIVKLLNGDKKKIPFEEPTKSTRFGLKNPEDCTEKKNANWSKYFFKPYRYLVEVTNPANKYKDKMKVAEYIRSKNAPQ